MSLKIKESSGDKVKIKIPSDARISSDGKDSVASWEVGKKRHHLRVKPDGSVLYQRDGTVWKHKGIVDKEFVPTLRLKASFSIDPALGSTDAFERSACSVLNKKSSPINEKSAINYFLSPKEIETKIGAMEKSIFLSQGVIETKIHAMVEKSMKNYFHSPEGIETHILTIPERVGEMLKRALLTLDNFSDK